MNSKTVHFIAFALLLAGIASAAQSLRMEWSGTTPSYLPTYLATDVELASSFNSSTTYCYGAPVNFSMGPGQPRWNTAYIDGGTRNGAAVATDLYPAPSQSFNYNINWLTPSQSSSLYSYTNSYYGQPRVFRWSTAGGLNEWNPFLVSIGIPSYNESNVGIKYIEPAGTSWFGGGNTYLAYAALFCNAKLNIKVMNSTSIQLTSSDDYYGTAIHKTITLQRGIYLLSGNISVERCMASLRNDMIPVGTKTVYIATNSTFAPFLSAASSTITVEDQFSCNNVSTTNLSFTPPNPVPGQKITFTFTIVNNGIRPVTVNPAALNTTSTGYTNFAITSPSSTFNIPANGGRQVVTGTVIPSSSAGQLIINVPMATTTVDCAGMTYNCTHTATYSNISTNAMTCSLAFSGNGSLGDDEMQNIAATCFQNGVRIPCPYLNWAQNATMVALSQSYTGAQDSSYRPQAEVALHVLPGAPAPQRGLATASNSSLNMTCTIPFNVTSAFTGLQITCGLVNMSSNILFPGQSVNATARCLMGGVPIMCPDLNWSTDIIGATLTPSHVPPPPSMQPTSLFSTPSTASVPQSGAISIICSSPAACSNATCSISMGLMPIPDNCTISTTRTPYYVTQNDNINVSARCTALTIPTACPPLLWSTENSIIIGSSFSPNPTAQIVDPETKFTTVNAPIPQSGYIAANNTLSLFNLTCNMLPMGVVENFGVDYNITKIDKWNRDLNLPILFGRMEDVMCFNIEVRNIGNVNATNASTVVATVSSGCIPINPLSYSLPALNTGVKHISNCAFACTCREKGIQTITIDANPAPHAQDEYSYINNVRTETFICGLTTMFTCKDFV